MTSNDPAWVYETNQVRAIFGPWARVLVDLARPVPGERVLDGACGTGVVARLVAPSVRPTGSVAGLDFDAAMIAVAKELSQDIDWQQGDLQRLPFADDDFDLVVCQQGLQFLPDRAAGLREMHRVLRPGGRIVLGIWTELAKSPGQAALFGALGSMLGKDMSAPPPWSLADAAEVMKLVSAASFTDTEMTTNSLAALYSSAREFVEIMIAGTSKLTRQALEQIPADRKVAFIDSVARSLSEFETDAGIELPNESRLLVAYKAR
jgi:ubiquinone/menaquinone biosynthesis C-methylase UbiE